MDEAEYIKAEREIKRSLLSFMRSTADGFDTEDFEAKHMLFLMSMIQVAVGALYVSLDNKTAARDCVAKAVDTGLETYWAFLDSSD